MSSSIVSTATVSGETWCTPSEWKSREQKNSLHVQFDRLEVALSFTRDSVMLTSIIIRSNANANVACAFKFVVQAAGWFKYYFGGAFNKDAIHNNFVLIYEFLVGMYCRTVECFFCTLSFTHSFSLSHHILIFQCYVFALTSYL
ncbi:uncharacterized protein LOC128285662 isoform X1 [Gossypium arboreum]|uniref:uncharacterized protein LOC128285662 isoform X1 n=1 Tax=Gossypium arboreum TaxID=29729 RepID=UPI0022F1CBE6|nr:uncharacterized protein LOC128285662 isoform X1 [Gossypium arboreum]